MILPNKTCITVGNPTLNYILNGHWDENEEFIIYQFYELPCLIAIDGIVSFVSIPAVQGQ